MNTRLTIAAIAMIAVIHFTAAQETTRKFSTTEEKIAFAKKNIRNGLLSDNAGVLESAMRLTAQMKLKYPATDVKELAALLDKISVSHSSGRVRYKAYIASNICNDPQWYAEDHRVTTATEEDFFRIASERLQQKLYSINSY
jgi:hypothetical protein